MVKFFRLTLLRPIERFLAQCISVSTEPSAFVRKHIRLGDTTNFLRAAKFFLSAISTAFLAEVATLYLLGIGNLAEPYYWLFILLTSIPFVLFCFLLVRLVAPLSFKDVLHLSFYPIGAGIFTGAAFALVASAVVGLLVATGYIPEIKYDFTQWRDLEQLTAVMNRAFHDCVKQESLVYAILATGLQEAYTNLKPPIDSISYLRPIIALLFLIVAARFFMAAVDRRKAVVFSLVLLAALLATGANYLSLKTYFHWKEERTSCQEKLVGLGFDRVGESALKDFARGVQASPEVKDNVLWDISVQAEGRTLSYTYRFKRPVMGAFDSFVRQRQMDLLKTHCSEDDDFVLKLVKATETHTYYGPDGERLTGFSISPADCPRW